MSSTDPKGKGAPLAAGVEAPRGASRDGAVFGSDAMADALRALHPGRKRLEVVHRNDLVLL